MSSANGKVRPDWMGGDDSEEQSRNGAVTTAAHRAEERPAEEPEQQQPEATEESGRVNDPDTSERIPTREEPAEETQPAADHGDSGDSSYSAAPSSGRRDQHHTPAGVSTSIRTAISAFVGRISGKGGNGVPGGGEPGAETSTRQESPAEVEKRLRVSLRETGVDGFRRLAVGSMKGGVGKSSLAYCVAGAISSGTNLRVCLVDADPNFGATRWLVPRPVEASVLDLSEDADKLERLADIRRYISQNELMGLDVLLNPLEAAQISRVEDLADAYERIDSVLSRFYDVVIYDLGLGFRDEAIRRVLSLSDELLLISDAEVIPNAQLPDALRYVSGLRVNLAKTTLAINHGRPPEHESASTSEVRAEHASHVRRITEVPYDAALSRLLNTRAFHIESLALPARLGVLTTAAAALEGLRRDSFTDAYEKVISMSSGGASAKNTHQRGGR